MSFYIDSSHMHNEFNAFVDKRKVEFKQRVEEIIESRMHEPVGSNRTGDIDEDLRRARNRMEEACRIAGLDSEEEEPIPGSIFADKKPNTLFSEAAEMFQKISMPNKMDDETFGNQLSCLL